MRNPKSAKSLRAVWNRVEKFIIENDIHCAETVAQSDRVIVNAYDFITDLCDIVGYKRADD